MIRNFLWTTFRYFAKNKGYSFLNIFGLAIGIACAGLIFLWVEDEISFDNTQIRKDRLYIVNVNAKVDNGILTHASTPGPLAPSLRNQIPGVVNTCRTSEEQIPIQLRSGEKSIYATGIYAESSLFDMFTLPFVQGNPANAFSQLYSLVLTESTARKFFGSSPDIIGRKVSADNKQEFVVTGVIRDLPANSSLKFDWIAPLQLYYQQYPNLDKWSYYSLSTYVEMQPGSDIAAINHRLADPLYDFTIGRKDSTPSTDHIYLFGMKDWRLYNQFAEGKPTGGGRIEYVRLFSVIAWIILAIGCINFMNLATARSEKRAREVGVRKVIGARKTGLIAQFIGEAIIMAMLAMGAALIIMSFALPSFNTLVQKNLHLDLDQPLHWMTLLALALICGLVAGSYPSFYLSSFKPVAVLKGMKLNTGGAQTIRQGLVILQFAISTILVIGTLIVYLQIKHVKDRNLGFRRDHLIQLALQGNMQSSFQAIRQRLINIGAAENAALSDHPALENGNNTTAITWPGKDPGTNIVISQRLVSPEFRSTMDMHLSAGKDFNANDELSLDSSGKFKNAANGFHVIITESMERLLGKGSAIGKTMDFHSNFGELQLTVKGVVKDIVYGDIYGKESSPIIFYDFPQVATLMYIRTGSQYPTETSLKKIEAVLKDFNPGHTFDLNFVDDQFNAIFSSEMLIARLSRIFSILAIFVSCLGLFGLAAHTAERRTREIGIRKVLGASASGIARLLSGDFLKLVLIACLIAFPIAWLIMDHWLKHYPYRISISWWVFALGGFLAVCVAFFTVSYQALRAALANPVRSLRTE